MLGFDVSERTISRWMKRAPRDPEPARRWLTFLRNHREAIAAMDFFTVPTITFSSLYCFFVISHDRRRILHFNVTKHPTLVDRPTAEKHFHLDPLRGSSSLIVMPTGYPKSEQLPSALCRPGSCGLTPSMRRPVDVKAHFRFLLSMSLRIQPSRLCRHPSIRTLL
jgi:hypothetical protein